MFNRKLKRRLAELENLLGYAWVNGGGYFNHESLSYGALKRLEERIKDLEDLKSKK